MSRCYPFPPPGFVPNRVRDESLIEPIKKGTKKETKREKKDRKHNKDKKRKERDTEAGRSREHRHHKRQRKYERASASNKVDDDNELESLEKSCLTTIEPDNQASSHNSSDSSENEGPNHIQYQSQPFDGRHNDSETSIRVLLHGKGQKYPEVMMINEDQKQCSSSRGKLDSSHAALCECVGHPYSTYANQAPRRVCQEKTKDPVFDSAMDISTKLGKEEETNRQFSMQRGEEKRASSSHQESIGPSKLCSKCPPSTAMRFLKLIENWAPESKLNDSEDEELWLLMKVGAKRHHGQARVQTSGKGSSSMVWATTAQFLPEAELHALPFTVPF